MLVRAIKILPIGYMIHKQDMFIEDEYNPKFESEYYGFLSPEEFEKKRKKFLDI